MNWTGRSRPLGRDDADVSGVAPPHRPTRIRLLGALTGAGLVLAAFGVYLVGQRRGDEPVQRPKAAVPAPVPPRVSAAALAQQNGVRIVHVAISGAGGLVDLRYQVIDPDKATVVHGTSPELVDETTGAVVNQLLMGHEHKGVMHAGQTYYLIFNNPGNLVHRGTRVTVVLGGLRVPHIQVE